MYIVTSPDDVLSVYKNTKALDFNPIIKDIVADFGVTSATLERMFEERFKGKQDTFLSNIDRSLNWDKLSGPMVISGSGKDEKVVSLFK
jgi:hypothetical protein